MKKYILLLLVLSGSSAMASYVKTCIFRGVISSQPHRSHSGLWTFDFEVQMAGAARDGRADGGCKNHEKNIKVSLEVEDRKLVLKKGQVLWLRDFYKNNKGSTANHDFSLLSEAEGKQLMDPEK